MGFFFFFPFFLYDLLLSLVSCRWERRLWLIYLLFRFLSFLSSLALHALTTFVNVQLGGVWTRRHGGCLASVDVRFIPERQPPIRNPFSLSHSRRGQSRSDGSSEEPGIPRSFKTHRNTVSLYERFGQGRQDTVGIPAHEGDVGGSLNEAAADTPPNSSVDVVATFTVVHKRYPVLFVEIKPTTSLRFNSKREQADNQIRQRFHNLRDNLIMPRELRFTNTLALRRLLRRLRSPPIQYI